MTTIITLVVLVSLGIVIVDGECQTNGGPIDNCCCLGYNNNYNVKSSGVYTISNFCGVKYSSARIYCDTTSGGGGWTVIQRRKVGSIDFKNRDWVEHEDGFGNVHGEFWLGLRSMHCLTSQGKWELRIDYHLSNGTKSYLHYKQFSVGPAEDQYQLSISGFDSVGLTTPFSSSGSVNGLKFSSRDRDNDLHPSYNCAVRHGGWWHRSCGAMHILVNGHNDGTIIAINNQWHAPTLLEFKIRPQDCNQ